MFPPWFGVYLPFFSSCISFTLFQCGLPWSSPPTIQHGEGTKEVSFYKSLLHGPILLPFPLLTTLKMLPLPQAKWPHWVSVAVLRALAELLLCEVRMAMEENHLCSPSHSLGQIVKKTMTTVLFSFLPCILLLTQPSAVSIQIAYLRKERKEKKENKKFK